MPNRIRVALIASLTIASTLLAAAPAGAVATPQKVVIIVGPTGAQTDGYRSKGDSIAAAAVAAGATAVKVYSPNATWANVKAAVNGANIVVYLGHGNGFPNPYNPNGPEPTDRDNGWGLNRTTTNGDGDNWSSTMVYCGEKALLGTLTSGSTAQWGYCGGSTNTDGITPAPNWVMIYSNACYAPGASEGWDTPATESIAMQRVRNYSYPGLVLGGGAYFATDMHEGAPQLVDKILRNPGMAFGAIAENANGYDLSRQKHFAHPDLSGTRVWIQNTGTPTSGDYFFAYAGKPGLTPSGTTVPYTEPVPAAPPLAASYGANPPTGWSGGVAQTYAVTLTNTGSQTWNATGSNRVRLGVAFGTASDSPGVGWATDQRFGLPADLAPGASVTLNLSVTPPTAAGNYVLRQRMVKEGVAWFAQIHKTNVAVGAQPALAAYYSSSPPPSWSAGQTQTYAITLTNTGSQTWNAAGANRVRLGVAFGTSSDSPGVGWATDQRFSLPADLAAGASVTISISVTAPAGAGSYVLRQRMVKEGVAWFPQIQRSNVTVAA